MSNVFSGICRVTQDPREISEKFVAVSVANGDGDSSFFLELGFVGRLINFGKSLKKGSPVWISGELQKRTYKDKDNWSVLVNSASFVNSSKPSSAKPTATATATENTEPTTAVDNDDEIPF